MSDTTTTQDVYYDPYDRGILEDPYPVFKRMREEAPLYHNKEYDFYAVSLNYGGRGAFHCQRELRDATPGTCNLIAPGELHTGHATSGDGWIYRNLYIETPLMTTLLRSLVGLNGEFDVVRGSCHGGVAGAELSSERTAGCPAHAVGELASMNVVHGGVR